MDQIVTLVKRQGGLEKKRMMQKYMHRTALNTNSIQMYRKEAESQI